MRIYKKTIDHITNHNTRMVGGFFTIPLHRELYLCKEIKQKVKTRFGFHLWTPVTVQTFLLPTEMVDFINLFVANEGKRMSFTDVELFRADVVTTSSAMAEQHKQHLEETTNMSEEMKKKISWSIDSANQRVHDMFTGMMNTNDPVMHTFEKTGSIMMSQETQGITTTYIFVRPLDGGIVFIRLEVGTIKNTKVIFSIEQFDLTYDFAKSLVNDFAISTKNSAGKE